MVLDFLRFRNNSSRTLVRTRTDTITLPLSSDIDLINFAVNAHILSRDDILQSYHTSQTDGLSKGESARRLARYGENRLKGDGGVSAWKVFFSQITNALTLVLIAALALSFGVQDWIEGSVIALVIVVNTAVGFFQEYRAEKTMDSLRQLSSPTGLVIRNGESMTIPSKDIVPGDLVMIRFGDVVPADLRLLNVTNLEISEQLLTGESIPVSKNAETYPDSDVNLPTADRLNLCYSSTIVATGRGMGIAIATGMNTQIGKIANTMQGKRSGSIIADTNMTRKRKAYETMMKWLGLRSGTPLQIKLSKFAYVLLLCAVLLVFIVFAVARFRVDHEVAIYGIATAIAIIPESLIAVLALTMAVGTRRMAERNVIVRNLDALENLGGVTDICSDKTGTLTMGRMTVRKLWLASEKQTAREFTAETTSKNSLEPVGAITEAARDGSTSETILNPESLDGGVINAVKIISLCNVASIHKNLRGEWKSTGDPTEVALQVFATKLGLGKPSLVYEIEDPNEKSPGTKENESVTPDSTETPEEKLKSRDVHFELKGGPRRYSLQTEFPFSSEVKRMTTIYKDREDETIRMCLIKGATERILAISSAYTVDPSHDDQTAPLTEALREEFHAQAEAFASQGLRVIAIGYRVIEAGSAHKISRDKAEKDFTFVGLVGIFDPPRPETADAVRACKEAGIVVHMLTGDHLTTAKAIAESVGILPLDAPSSSVMTATQFDALSDDQIDALPELPLVIARCEPNTKVRMIDAGKRRQKHLCMTGDGVNDAPALKMAPVGVAMGLAGSDVAKDASDLVLTDDNFDSIRAAVNDGRKIFLNIQRFILHLLTTNVAEVIMLVVGLAFIDKDGTSVFPLSPLSVLWVNMVTGSPPAFGLGLERAPPGLMKKRPHSVKVGVFTPELIIDTMSYGIVMGATSLLSFVVVVYGRYGGDLATECNRGPSPACEPVFRARSTAFATLISQILLYALELKSFERSIFSLTPGQPFWKDWLDNMVLFWSVLGGLVTVVIAIYVPGLNTRAFHQQGIDWEWGVVFGMTIVFVSWCEVWKLMRKRLFKMIGIKGEASREIITNSV